MYHLFALVALASLLAQPVVRHLADVDKVRACEVAAASPLAQCTSQEFRESGLSSQRELRTSHCSLIIEASLLPTLHTYLVQHSSQTVADDSGRTLQRQATRLQI